MHMMFEVAWKIRQLLFICGHKHYEECKTYIKLVELEALLLVDL